MAGWVLFAALALTFLPSSSRRDITPKLRLEAGIDYVQGEVLVTFASQYAPNSSNFSSAPPSSGSSPIDSIFESFEGTDLRKLLSTFDSYSSAAGQRLERTYLFRYETELDAQEVVDSLSSLGYFERVGLNRLVDFEAHGTARMVPGADTTRFADQWYFDNNDAGDNTDIDLPEAWSIEPGGNPDSVIGIFDEGTPIDTVTITSGWKLHSDFNHYWNNAEDTRSPGLVNGADLDGEDADGDGEGNPPPPYVYAANIVGFNLLRGYDGDQSPDAEYNKRFWYGMPVNYVLCPSVPPPPCFCCTYPSWEVGFWRQHGVWVASIAAAKLDGKKPPDYHKDIVGVAYNSQVYWGRFSKNMSWMVGAIVHLAKKCWVINMSFGTSTNDPFFADAVHTAASDLDCVLVASTGNEARDGVLYPAAYEDVLGVGAIQRSPMDLISISSWDPTASLVDVVAPVEGPYPPVADSFNNCDGPEPCAVTELAGQIGETGTSFAAPQASGLAVLVRTRFPSMGQADVRTRIKNAAQFYWADVDSNHYKFGSGKINAYRALTEWGSINGTVTWDASDTRDGKFYVSGDITIGDGAALTINQGVAVRVAPDHEATGADEDKVEIVVQDGGQLVIQGSSGQPVQFESFTDSAPSDTDWVGIRFEAGSSGSLEYVVIRNAEIAIDNASNDVAIDHATIEDCEEGITTVADLTLAYSTITDCRKRGVVVEGADSVYIGNTTIRNIGPGDHVNPIGLNVVAGSTVRINNSTIENVGYKAAQVISGSKLYAESTGFLDSDKGLFIHPMDSTGVDAVVSQCTVKHNDVVGIEIDGPSTGTTSVTSCLIDSNVTTGVFCGNADNVTLRNTAIQHSYTGLFSYITDVLVQGGNYIADNHDGIKFLGSSQAVVESTEVYANVVGVVAQSGANPDLGHESGGASAGTNIFYRNHPHHIENLDSTITIMAEVDWWGGSEPNPNRFVGSVDHDPWLEGETPPDIHYEEIPGQVAPFVPFEEECPIQFALSYNYPNPFNPVTTFNYEVPQPGAEVTITVYNGTGQLVTSLVNEYKSPGAYQVTWDGSNESGELMASGVYFVRMNAGSFSETRKIILLK